ncbi:Metallo-hydrolase/oxidoreductase [Piromyces finnis]|uniref:Metallo-hydrolase/oxidoreductase n=1 Tax=Piromyces finnis TaxID=1754191 RepID=A0A1Y1VC38_9FUNG|nr:Metallo-hydrolase/oxidoreductase [Piromyces finnis]|eukprot:ORX52542.1 Metallo-hydrolase/oxidoreductase [Piromyces finnis]
MNYTRKLPEREKNPETCCPSVKEGKIYKNPWPSATWRKSTYKGLLARRIYGYFTSSIFGREKNQQLKVDLDFEAINNYHNDDKNIAMQLIWLGHAAFLLQINSFTILFDPMLSKRASPLNFIGPYRCRNRGFQKFSQLPPIDFVILSHNHYDHLDKWTIQEIYAEEKNKKAKVLCPLDLKPMFLSLGIPENQIIECDWWDDIEVTRIPESIDVNDEKALQESLTSPSNRKIIISAVPSQHFSGRTGFDFNETLWAGWVVKSQEASYYFAGDTGYRSLPDDCPKEDIEKYPYCPVFKQIGNIYGPFDMASIPIGPFTPVNRMSRIHTNANDAVNLHTDCKSKHSILMHWGTLENLGVDEIERGPDELHKELIKKNIPLDEFHEVYIGQILKIEKKK